MILFQNSGLYPTYHARLDVLAAGARTFAERRDVFLADRFGALHFLKPVLDGDPSAFFTNADDMALQRMWAAESGMPSDSTPEAILLAQIEHHRTEVFYNMDPMRYGSEFVRKLPGCVRRSIAWRAAPSPGADFAAYDLVVCNFPSILRDYETRGWKSGYLAPAYDPVMDAYAGRGERPIDVLFVGGYSRHHARRARILETVARLRDQHRVVYHLDRSRLTRLAESRPGLLLPLRAHRRPPAIRAVSRDPVFGRALYDVLAQAKVVLNGAVDMAGDDRGNMRCFEALGCGALMVSDSGRYPEGMANGATMLTYDDADGAARLIAQALADPKRLQQIAGAGRELVRTRYNKAAQWARFQQLVGVA